MGFYFTLHAGVYNETYLQIVTDLAREAVGLVFGSVL